MGGPYGAVRVRGNARVGAATVVVEPHNRDAAGVGVAAQRLVPTPSAQATAPADDAGRGGRVVADHSGTARRFEARPEDPDPVGLPT